MSVDEPLVTSTEAAKAIGLTRHAINRWVREGKLRPTERSPGGHARWRVSDLREQIREMRNGPAAAP